MTISSLAVEELNELLEDELKTVIKLNKKTEGQMSLYDIMSYHMGWTDLHHMTAARNHGVLALLMCHAMNGDVRNALPAAAAVELVNSFCQIHDDVQGGIPQRDGRDAVWWVWGPAQAINAGDGMHALARLALFRLSKCGVSPDTTFRSVQLLDEAGLQACEGRFLDLEAQERTDVSVEAYRSMSSRKSGALYSCALKLAALLSGLEEPAIDIAGSAGVHIGVAIQMRSDILEIWMDEKNELRIPSEAMNKKKLLPVVYAIETGSAHVKRKIGETYIKRVLEPEDVDMLRHTLEELGVRDACDKLVEEHRVNAMRFISELPVSIDGRESVINFTDSLLALDGDGR